jgi:hypothetical protein
MRLLIGVIMISLAAAASASAQQREAAPVVHVGLFTYGPDAKVVGAAYENDQTALKSTVWTNRYGCGVGATSGKPPATATDVWEFSGRVVSTTADDAVVQFEWRECRRVRSTLRHRFVPAADGECHAARRGRWWRAERRRQRWRRG